MGRAGVRIHPTAEVAESARIGEGTAIWNSVQVRDGARIGADCIIGNGVFIDLDVVVGDRCKLQNGAYIFRGFSLEDGVFLGPGVMLLNDKDPRAITPEGGLKKDADWVLSRGLVMEGAAVGGGSVVLPGITLGRYCLVGAGSVVTRDVPDHGLVYGNPARLHDFVCRCAQRLGTTTSGPERTVRCPHCSREVRLSSTDRA